MTRRAAIIANPRSGKGRAVAAASGAAQMLHECGATVDVFTSTGPGDVSRIAATVCDDCDTLVVLGGDGTINEAVSGVLGRGQWPQHLALAPLPLGTCNSFLRDFGLLTGDWQTGVRRILEGHRRTIDAGRVVMGTSDASDTSDGEAGERPAPLYFANVFGTGFAARVAATKDRRFKALGGLGYPAAIFAELVRLSSTPTRLTLYGPHGAVVRDEALALVAVCNTQWTADGMWIAPNADPADGLLDVITLGDVSRLELVRLFTRIFSGRHLAHPAVTATRAERVRIEPATNGPLLRDGEVSGVTPVTVEALRGAVVLAF